MHIPQRNYAVYYSIQKLCTPKWRVPPCRVFPASPEEYELHEECGRGGEATVRHPSVFVCAKYAFGVSWHNHHNLSGNCARVVNGAACARLKHCMFSDTLHMLLDRFYLSMQVLSGVCKTNGEPIAVKKIKLDDKGNWVSFCASRFLYDSLEFLKPGQGNVLNMSECAKLLKLVPACRRSA